MELKYDEITIGDDGKIHGYWSDSHEGMIHPVLALDEYEKVAQMYEQMAAVARERVRAIEIHGIDDIINSILVVAAYDRAVNDWMVGSRYIHEGRGSEYAQVMSTKLPQLKERIFKLHQEAILLSGTWELFTGKPFTELPEM